MGKWIALGLFGIALDIATAFGLIHWFHVPPIVVVPIAAVILVVLLIVVLAVLFVEVPEEPRENRDRREKARAEARNMQQQRFKNETANKVSHLLWPVQTPPWELPDHGHAMTNMPLSQLSHARQAPGPSDGDEDYEVGAYGGYAWENGVPRLVTPPKPKAARGESQ